MDNEQKVADAMRRLEEAKTEEETQAAVRYARGVLGAILEPGEETYPAEYIERPN